MRFFLGLSLCLTALLASCGDRERAGSDTDDMVQVCIRHNGGAEACQRKYGRQSGAPSSNDMVQVCIRYNGGANECQRKYGSAAAAPQRSGAAGTVQQSAPTQARSGGMALANAAESAAARRGTVGYCYGGVADAMDVALGTSASTWTSLGIGASHAYEFSDWANANPSSLEKVFGLRRASVAAASAPVGSLFIYEPGHCGMSARSGHIEIKTGSGRACSDHCRAYGCEPSYVYVPVR